MKGDQILFIVEDPRTVLKNRIINIQGKLDFLIGWNYKYILDSNDEIKAINGFSLKYYYDQYKNKDNFHIIRIESLICYGNLLNYSTSHLTEDCLRYNNRYLNDYIKDEIIRNPEILDCLIDYGYEKDKEWIKQFDENIFEKIEENEQKKQLNEIVIKKIIPKKVEKKIIPKKVESKKRKKKRSKKIISPFPNKSNQERNIEYVKRMKEKRRGN